MIKETISYEDFNGEKQVETLYFHLSKTEVIDHMDLQDRFVALSSSLTEDRELREDEVREILDIVKTMMRLSYGQRSADGRHFRKSEEIWDDFKSTAAYDAYLFSLFENPEKAVGFLLGVLPQDVVEEAKKKTAAAGDLPTASPILDQSDEVVTNVQKTQLAPPAYVVEDREPTDEELRSMGKEELLEAMKWKMNRQS